MISLCYLYGLCFCLQPILIGLMRTQWQYHTHCYSLISKMFVMPVCTTDVAFYSFKCKINKRILVITQLLCLLLTWSIPLSSPRRHLLHHCFQALMDHGVKVASVLANSFSRRCSYIAESDAHVKEKAIQFGFVLGKWGRGAGGRTQTL